MGQLKQVFIDINAGEFKELQKGDELVGSEVPMEATISDLRNRVGYYKNQVVYLLGGAAVGDGAGKNVFWNPDSTATADGDTVFKPDSIDASDPGRWIAYFDAYDRSEVYKKSETYSQTEADNKFIVTYLESNDNEITL